MNAPSLPATIQVSSVPAATVPAGFIQITVPRRATKDENGNKKTIPADQRSRSIIIQEWAPNVPQRYLSLVLTALHNTAKAQLAEQWEANPGLLVTHPGLYREDALLLWAARKSESAKLSAESIRAWWLESDLRSRLTAKYTEAQLARMLAELENLAAPVLSSRFYNEDSAVRRIASIGASDRDAESEIGSKMILRLQRFVDAIRAERDAIGSVEELED